MIKNASQVKPTNTAKKARMNFWVLVMVPFYINLACTPPPQARMGLEVLTTEYTEKNTAELCVLCALRGGLIGTHVWDTPPPRGFTLPGSAPCRSSRKNYNELRVMAFHIPACKECGYKRS